MPKIIFKRPQSNPSIIDVSSSSLSDLYRELDFFGTYESIGTGMLLLFQLSNEYDDPNIIYEGKGILGAVYAVRATKSKIVDIDSEDLEYFLSVITEVKAY